MEATDQFTPLPFIIKFELVSFVPKKAQWKCMKDQFNSNFNLRNNSKKGSTNQGKCHWLPS